MIKVTVTGACGFIGSHLTKQLIERGFHVVGVDCLDDNLYSRSVKESRLKALKQLSNFDFANINIATDELDSSIGDSKFVFNLAAIPGQVLSWKLFDKYVESNILGTKKVIDSCIRNKVTKIIHSSASSVYGKFAVGDELQDTKPISPYGITKLAAENLLFALTSSNNLDFTILRYFSVYGPGQRPDMAIQKFLTAIKMGQEINITGDGTQKRDITYVQDVVEATISASSITEKKQIFNISGGKQFTLNQIIDECFNVSGLKSKINYVDRPIGDQEETFGDISKAQKLLGFNPTFDIKTGLSNQFASLT
jgi:nucleoside-diphosphate-sugar epimerase